MSDQGTWFWSLVPGLAGECLARCLLGRGISKIRKENVCARVSDHGFLRSRWGLLCGSPSEGGKNMPRCSTNITGVGEVGRQPAGHARPHAYPFLD